MKTIKQTAWNLGSKLDYNLYSLTILQYRNTLCRFPGLSLAQILFTWKLMEGVAVELEHLQLHWVGAHCYLLQHQDGQIQVCHQVLQELLMPPQDLQ